MNCKCSSVVLCCHQWTVKSCGLTFASEQAPSNTLTHVRRKILRMGVAQKHSPDGLEGKSAHHLRLGTVSSFQFLEIGNEKEQAVWFGSGFLGTSNSKLETTAGWVSRNQKLETRN